MTLCVNNSSSGGTDAYVQVRMHLNVYECQEYRLTSGAVHLELTPCLKWDLSMISGLLIRLGSLSKQALGICLSPPLQLWNYKNVCSSTSDFYKSAGSWSPCLHSKHFTNWALSQTPLFVFKSCWDLNSGPSECQTSTLLRYIPIP